MDLEKRTEIPNSLEEHWMPFTSNRDYKNSPRLMVKAEGVYYTDHYGNKLIDASSGLFCSPAGHSRPEIREAVSKQLEQLDYVQPFQQGFGGSFDFQEHQTISIGCDPVTKNWNRPKKQKTKLHVFAYQ